MMALILAATLTVLVEFAVFALLGYRGKVFFTAIVLVNVASNLSLNLIFMTVPEPSKVFVLTILELAVVIVEWVTLTAFSDRSGTSLFLTVLLANIASFSAGLLLF